MNTFDLQLRAKHGNVRLAELSTLSLLAVCSPQIFGIKIEHVTTNQLLEIPFVEMPRALAFRPGSNELAIARSDCISRLNISLGSSLQRSVNPGDHLDLIGCASLAFNAEGTLLAAGCEDGTVCIWRLDDFSTRASRLEHRIFKARLGVKAITDLCFVSDDSQLVVLTEEGRVYRVPLDEECGRVKAKLVLAGACGNELDWHCLCMAAHPRDSILALSGMGDTLWIRNLRNDALFVIRTGLGRFVHKLSFLADGKRLVAAGETGIAMYDMETRVLKQKWMYLGDYSLAGRAVLLPREPGRLVARFEGGEVIKLMKEVGDALVVGWC